MFLALISIFALQLARVAAWNSYSTVENLPGCPCSLTFVDNLDKDLLGGDWYVQYLSNSTLGGCNGDCWTLNLLKRSSAFMEVEFCCNKGGYRYCEADVGSGSISDPPCRPGQLTYSTGGFDFPAFIPEVQYDRFLTGIFCSVDPAGRPIQSLYIFSRDPVPDASFVADTFEVFRKLGLDPTKLDAIPRGPQCSS